MPGKGERDRRQRLPACGVAGADRLGGGGGEDIGDELGGVLCGADRVRRQEHHLKGVGGQVLVRHGGSFQTVVDAAAANVTDPGRTTVEATRYFNKYKEDASDGNGKIDSSKLSEVCRKAGLDGSMVINIKRELKQAQMLSV